MGPPQGKRGVSGIDVKGRARQSPARRFASRAAEVDGRLADKPTPSLLPVHINPCGRDLSKCSSSSRTLPDDRRNCVAIEKPTAISGSLRNCVRQLLANGQIHAGSVTRSTNQLDTKASARIWQGQFSAHPRDRQRRARSNAPYQACLFWRE